MSIVLCILAAMSSMILASAPAQAAETPAKPSMSS